MLILCAKMTETRNDFCITLPSNSNLESHPKNRPDDYIVSLGKPISLVGDWEVSAVNIHYPHNWYDFRKTTKLYWAYYMHTVRVPHAEVASYVRAERNSDTGQFSLTLKHSNWIYGSREDNYRLGSVVFKPNHYVSVEEIGARLVKHVNDALSKGPALVRTPVVTFEYNAERRHGSIATDTGTMYLFADNDYLASMLGIGVIPTVPLKLDRNEPVSEIGNIYMFSGHSTSLFTMVDSIYLYCDIAENQYVGNVEVPLLGIIPVQGQHEDKRFFTFNPPVFVGVKKKEFGEVPIRLRTSQGEPLPFPRFTPEVIVTLRFRRRKAYV
jgi:hypothetical protein